VAGRRYIEIDEDEFGTCGECVLHRNEANSVSDVDRSPERRDMPKSSTWTIKIGNVVHLHRVSLAC
jgi:hypothetical protein